MDHSGAACSDLVSTFQFQDIRSAEPPKEKGVYVIRVTGHGEPVTAIVQNVGIRKILNSIQWPQVEAYVMSRLNRLVRIDDCAIIYIGSAAPRANSSNTLHGRYRELANRHTAMYPVWALLSFDWRLEFGWEVLNDPKNGETELKRRYKALHGGHLPALVER